MKCYKCEGKGHIEGFSHVANGRCFLCGGSGELSEAKKQNVGFARSFVLNFRQSGFFPESLSAAKVHRIGGEHETAEEWVMEDSGFYYLGKPVCRASGWYKIPKADWSEFTKYYLKAFKVQLV